MPFADEAGPGVLGTRLKSLIDVSGKKHMKLLAKIKIMNRQPARDGGQAARHPAARRELAR
jgi:hypothetical protein